MSLFWFALEKGIGNSPQMVLRTYFPTHGQTRRRRECACGLHVSIPLIMVVDNKATVSSVWCSEAISFLISTTKYVRDCWTCIAPGHLNWSIPRPYLNMLFGHTRTWDVIARCRHAWHSHRIDLADHGGAGEPHRAAGIVGLGLPAINQVHFRWHHPLARKPTQCESTGMGFDKSMRKGTCKHG